MNLENGLQNIIIRGTVTTNIHWWKHAEHNEQSQSTLGSVRVKISSIKADNQWKSIDYSLYTGGYKQVIPFLEIIYPIEGEYSLESLERGLNIEMIVNVPSLYMNEHSIEIKGEYKHNYLKIPHRNFNIPVIKIIKNLSLNGEYKRIISTSNLVNLLIPQEVVIPIMIQEDNKVSLSEQIPALIG